MPTRILARDLHPAASARLGGVSEVYLDTPENFRMPMSKDVERLSDLNKIRVEGALRTSLDRTDTNDAVLVEYLTPLTLDKRSKWLNVVIEVDGIAMAFTRLYIISKNDDTAKWEVEAALPEDHWAELASQKKINTIDFGGYTLNADNVQTSWEYPTYDGDYTPTQDVDGWNGAYGLWPVDYGDWVDRSMPDPNTIKPVKMMAQEDLRPHVNKMYLLKRGMKEIGWELAGLLQETAWARSLWAYLLRPEYWQGKGYDGVEYGKFCRIIGRNTTGPLNVSSLLADRFIYFDSLDFLGHSGAELPFDGDPSKWMCGIQNPLPFRAKFKLSFKFEMTAHASIVVPQVITFNIAELDATVSDNNVFTGEILSDDASISLDVGESKFAVFDFEVELNPGQKGALNWMGDAGLNIFIITKGFWFRCEPKNQALTREDELDVRTMLDPDLTLLDMLKAWVHLVNGRIETNMVTKTIYVHPERSSIVYDSTVPGFVRDDIPAIDVSNDILPNSVKLQFIRPELKRYTLLAFADSTDAHIDENLVLTEPLHSRRILNGEDLPNDTDEQSNPVYEPTAEGQSPLLKQNDFSIVNRPNAPVPWLPRYWDNTNGERSFDIGPRILFAFGYVRQLNPSPIGTTDIAANYYFDDPDDPMEEIGYATQLRTWELDPAPTIDGNVVFGRAAADLFVNFYLGLTQDNRGGVVVDVLQRITAAEYSAYNFRIPFKFDYEGRELRLPMTSIRDFNPDLPTPVTYFGSPAETGVCDLPCNCRFETCDYYQDLGTFILQSTMDALSVSSFTIDGVEQLTAPVPLGQLNVVDLGGSGYVTNLVDALNSIGAPYFAFSYSTRQHPERGARFFKIKRPACQAFEIIVSDGNDPVYRYTHNAQQEMWFAGSWGDIGYGTELLSAPDNCVTTIEY
jgi:hypothetical protein